MNMTLGSITAYLQGDEKLVDDVLQLQHGSCHLQLRSNSKQLIEKLRLYFEHCNVLASQVNEPVIDHIEMLAFDYDPLVFPEDSNIQFVDWKREPGKTGRKDETMEFQDHGEKARLLRKVRTGMVFLQSKSQLIAAGPCVAYANQVVNYINSQFMNVLQHKNWTICHASALLYKQKGVAIAGFSGGGKSTFMLKLMHHPEFNYVTNDRLFIRQGDGQPDMLGIPKLPRINPGTIVGDPKLHSLMAPEQLKIYQDMERHILWDVEVKHDLAIRDIYGESRMALGGKIHYVILLSWKRQHSEPVSLTKVNIEERRDLLGAIMKPSGPFYQDPEGVFQEDTAVLDEESYLKALAHVETYEVKGKIDFDQLTELFISLVKERDD